MIKLNEEQVKKLEEIVPTLEQLKDKITGILLFIDGIERDVGESDVNVIELIKTAVCDHFKIYWADVAGYSRKQELVWGRQIFMAIARKMTNLSHSKCAKFVNKDHATACHAVRVIKEAGESHHELYDHYEMILNRVKDLMF